MKAVYNSLKHKISHGLFTIFSPDSQTHPVAHSGSARGGWSFSGLLDSKAIGTGLVDHAVEDAGRNTAFNGM